MASGVAMTVTDTTILEAVLRRDRMILFAALVGVVAIAWILIVLGAGTRMSPLGMTRRSGMPVMAGLLIDPRALPLGYAALMFTMWHVSIACRLSQSAAPIL